MDGGDRGESWIPCNRYHRSPCLFFVAAVLILRASFRGMDLAFVVPDSIIPDLYSLAIRNCFSSTNLCSLWSTSVHIVTILRAIENGMLSLVWGG